GERFSLYNLEERSFIYGPAKTCNVQKFTQVPVSAEALVELLRGRPPVLRHAPEDAQITFRKHLFSRGQYELEIAGRDETSELMEIGLRKEDYSLPPEKQRLRLLGVQVVQAGETLYEVRLSDYRPARRASQALSPEEEALGMSPRPPSGPACEAELPGR